MPVTLQSLLELQPTEGAPVSLFGDDKFIVDNTMLSRGRQTERCKVAFKWDKEEYLRALAPATGRGAASKSVAIQSPTFLMIGGVYFRINFPFTGELLNALRSPGSIGANAAAEVQKARRSLRNRLLLSKEKLWSMALKGTTTINSTVFPDGTVEGVSITWGVTTLAVSASWNTINTPIVSNDCEDMRADIVDASGFRIERFLFNESIAKMIAKNTEFKDHINALPRAERALTNAPDRFDGVGGVPKWWEYLGSYKPEGGSLTRFIGDNELVALPEGWEQLAIEARFAMDRPASQFLVASRAEDMIPEEVYGDEDGIDEYVVQEPDPAGMKLVMQMGVQPILKIPEAFGFESAVTS